MKQQSILTVGDLKKALSVVSNNVEVVLSEGAFLKYPVQGASYFTSHINGEQVGEYFGIAPIKKGHLEANPDAYSKEIHDRVNAVHEQEQRLLLTKPEGWSWGKFMQMIRGGGN